MSRVELSFVHPPLLINNSCASGNSYSIRTIVQRPSKQRALLLTLGCPPAAWLSTRRDEVP
eukprot:scaffold47629_cov33-Phaeocystis_antarctica.AAC.1